MSEVLRAVGIFCSYAVLAVFAQSAVFTRGLGVSRLVQLVGDDRTNSWWFALLLCVTQLLVAPLAFYAGRFIAPLANRAQLRPVVYVACVAVVCIFEHLVLRAVKGPRSGQLLRILPVAAINSCVLGILCAIWRALAQHRKNYLKTEARNTVAVHHQKEANREHE